MAQKYYGVPPHLRRVPAPAPAPKQPAGGAQERCDAVQAEFRAEAGEKRSIRRYPPPRPPEIGPTSDGLSLRLADELDYARRLIEQMGDTLAADPTVIGRHMVALQAVDVVGQMLGHVAAVVRSSDPAASVDQIGMADLRARLQRRGGL